jgi:hypothetical protein
MLRPATIDDAFALAPRLRLADIEEVQAAGHPDMDVVLAESISTGSESWAFEVDGVVHAIMGVVDAKEFGVPWMLGSDEIFKYRKALLTLPHAYLPRWLEQFGLLQNLVHSKNRRSIRWLQSLGFTLGPPVQLNGHPFHLFTMGHSYV